ncbi:MAG: ester cyclase [Chloroflexi bacterium]|nr:ester cyclase [Chloroflexota bacterium]MCH8893494.1 ester cyclase [Chloroflexota bacterium]MCH9016898.1 ester cyclase [Chloroflexota bacterium]MCI0810520.1 ester cyclase [Chloroflexota bacterium]MCI0830435.1 ester cyclase [Chloroflexota bacterium]
MLDDNKKLIHHYYDDLWNRWDDAVIDEIIAPDIQFRGSLGVTVAGRSKFRGYVAQVRAAFPDFHNHVEELLAEGDGVMARLTYSGTHLGELYGAAPTGKRVEYGGIALFKISDGRITSGLVYGDTIGLMRQVGAPTPEIS